MIGEKNFFFKGDGRNDERRKGQALGTITKRERRIAMEQIKSAAEIAKILLQKPLMDGDQVAVTDVDELNSLLDVKGKNISVTLAMLVAQVKKAVEKGDTKAMQVLLSLTGDYKEHSDVEVKTDPFKGLSLEELRKIANLEEPLQ